MIRALGLAVALLGTAAAAQDFTPVQRFEVVGVDANDVLNIRSGPEVTAPKLGEYAPDATDIEVIRTTPDGRWAMVGAGEVNGWVAARFLVAQPEQGQTLPQPLRCFGTEPFWSLMHGVDGTAYNDPESGRIPVDLTQSYPANNGFLARFDSVETAQRLMIRQGYCSDGMSDREFGYTAALFFQSAAGSRVMSGCCTFDGH